VNNKKAMAKDNGKDTQAKAATMATRRRTSGKKVFM
jgi:hypothetical protein